MNKGINLLPHQKKQNVVNVHIVMVLERLSLVVLSVIVFLSLILFAFNYDTTLPALKRQENATLTNLTLLRGRTAKILFIKDRLQSISLTLKSRKSYDSIINQMLLLIPKDVTIDNLSFSKGVATIDFSSSSLLSLSNLLDTVTDMTQNKQTFKTLNLTSIVADNATLRYTVSIQAKLL